MVLTESNHIRLLIRRQHGYKLSEIGLTDWLSSWLTEDYEVSLESESEWDEDADATLFTLLIPSKYADRGKLESAITKSNKANTLKFRVVGSWII